MEELHNLSVGRKEKSSLNGTKEDVLRTARVVGGTCTEEKINKTIKELRDQLMDYVGVTTRERGGGNQYSSRMRKLGLQINELRRRRKNTREQGRIRDKYEYLDREISRIIGKTGGITGAEFDNIFIRQIIREIRVISKNKLQAQLRIGMVLDVNL